jgi:hypothetical protein
MDSNKTKQVVDDQIWGSRIQSANKYHDAWENLFKCKILEDYYEGRQWANVTDGYSPYTINKFFETIEIKIAEFIPTFPKYQVSAREANSADDLESAAEASTLKQDILNTIIMDNKQHFRQEMEMAYKDSYFRFGMVEVGYAADWILNPNAQRPLLASGTDPNAGKKHKVVKEPDELPINERVYFKHIGARRFRVGGVDNKYLNRCSWVGYYEFVYKDDLLSLKGVKNKDKIESAVPQDPHKDVVYGDSDHEKMKSGAVKIWHIWDIRAGNRLIILDSPCTTIYEKKFKRLNLFDYRPNRRTSTEGFYPVPPAFQWLSSQDEINETRESQRAHRRRFVRKFQVVQDFIDDEEIEKFENGADGALVKVKRPNAILPIDNANMGPENKDAMVTSSDDLNKISGTSSESRGVADRTTATQAQIINQRSSIRETHERDLVVDWLCNIGREVLLTARDKFVIGVWARLTSNIKEQFLGQVEPQNPAYQWVSSEKLQDGYDFRIDVDVTSLSENAAQDEKQKFIEFLSVLANYPAIAFSPLLVREAAYRVGYRNEAVIKELQKMALMQEMGRQQMMQQQSQVQPGAGPSNGATQLNQQMQPNTQSQITQQIQKQVPGVQ